MQEDSRGSSREAAQLELIQRVARVGYWEYDPDADPQADPGADPDAGRFWMPPLSIELLAELAGRAPTALVTLLHEALHHDERRRFRETLDLAVAGQLPMQQEIRLESGAVLAVRGGPQRTADGRTCYAGTFQDITREKTAEQEREMMIGKFNALLKSLRVGVTVFDQDLRLLFWNDMIHDILGLPQGAVYKYVRFEELIRYPAERGEYGPGDPAELVRERAERARRFEAHRFEREARDGRILLVEGYPLHAAGEVSGFITTYSDITAHKQVEARLVRQNSVLSTIIDNFPGAISLFDADLRLVAHNDQFRTLLELPHSLVECEGVRFVDFIRFNAQRGEYGPGDIEEKVAGIMARAANFQPHKLERVRPDGTALEIRGMPLPGGGFVTTYIDVTERRRAEERIRTLALQDALTGLPNRLNLNERIEQALDHARRDHRPFALLFLDLDGFKAINDTLGHDAGDELLIEVADRLVGAVRETDVVARLGGDEFVILLHDVDDAPVPVAIAEKIIATLARPAHLERGIARIGTSIGIALYPRHGVTRELMLKAADEAMYTAKRAGRGVWRLAG